MEAGKLYICEEYFLLLYPDQEAAAAASAGRCAAATAVAAAAASAATAAYWTRKLGKSVLYAKKNIPLLSLNNKEKYVEVLAGDRKGWIIVKDWLGIKEIQ
jgi:hypothetical protein